MSEQHTNWESYGSSEQEADRVLNASLYDSDGDVAMRNENNSGYVAARRFTTLTPENLNTAFVTADQFTTMTTTPTMTASFDLIPTPNTPFRLETFTTVNPENLILRYPSLAHLFNHALSSEELQYSRTLQQYNERRGVVTAGRTYTYPDPELYAVQYDNEEQNTVQSEELSIFNTTPLFSEIGYPTMEEMDFQHVDQATFFLSSAVQEPVLGERIVTYQFLQPSDVGGGEETNRLPSQIRIPPPRPQQRQQMPPPPPPPSPQQQQQRQLPDTYAGRRGQEAKKEYPFECSICSSRFLYYDSATKHGRNRHPNVEWSIVERWANAPKRPPSGQPRNEKNAAAQLRRQRK